MTGWLHYIEEMAYWYVMYFEQKDSLMITSVPLTIEDAFRIPFNLQGTDVLFHQVRIDGNIFAKIQQINVKQ